MPLAESNPIRTIKPASYGRPLETISEGDETSADALGQMLPKRPPDPKLRYIVAGAK